MVQCKINSLNIQFCNSNLIFSIRKSGTASCRLHEFTLGRAESKSETHRKFGEAVLDLIARAIRSIIASPIFSLCLTLHSALHLSWSPFFLFCTTNGTMFRRFSSQAAHLLKSYRFAASAIIFLERNLSIHSSNIY